MFTVYQVSRGLDPGTHLVTADRTLGRKHPNYVSLTKLARDTFMSHTHTCATQTCTYVLYVHTHALNTVDAVRVLFAFDKYGINCNEKTEKLKEAACPRCLLSK